MSSLLWYGESMYIETGAGQVAKHLLPIFQAHFSDIHLVAINQWWEQKNLPAGLRITNSTPDTDIWNVDAAKAAISACDYDCLFLTTDINKIDELKEEIAIARAKDIPVVMYAAMDSNYYSPVFFSVLNLASRAVVFSNWCQRLVRMMVPDLETSVIYHGCEPETFYPLPIEERIAARREIFGIEDDTFLVLNVNRNQVRKDLMRSMAAFHLFHLEHPDSVMYLHAKQQDFGGHLPTQAASLGMRIGGDHPEIIFAPETYNEAGGVSRSDLNRIYNAADVCISTATGEGWGLTTTEAMAAGVPFIGPDNTVFPEILGKRHDDWKGYTVGERGLLVESGGPNLWATFYGTMNAPREICSTTGMYDAMAAVLYGRKTAKQRAQSAREWTITHSWAQVSDQWNDVLNSIKVRELA